ncbi:MAG TPA: DUF1893 domain-containing protein [Dehalococcoidia bacterium]|nr:DUF1893 domain-containing protein [Dehalococcoidia bacterium]
MYARLFNRFLMASDTLQVYKGSKLLFASNKDRLLPLLEYIDRFAHYHQVVIFDKIMGNAAALLAVKAGCREVYSPLGSQFAIKTLDKYHIKYHLTETAPYIQKANGEDMCPMEILSMNKRPEEFYELIRNAIKGL